ncbi:MAG TPA: CoA ester lyase [Pseudolysinimonas sp.]|nr:CoA ester lyase [Pseudolysinimonas sp.]
MKPVRSLLFVPGHKADWIDKAHRSEADGIIIDLEDSVPEADKQLARENARAAIERFGEVRTIVVRPNALDTSHCGADVAAVAVAGLDALLLPKIYDRDDILRFDGIITAAELQNGTSRGAVGVIPSLETAKSLVNVHEILRGPRVVGVMGAAAKNADISREVGFSWTPEGLETLYLRSRAVLAARAAGLNVILLGLWQEIHDLEGLRVFAEENARLGFTGQVLIHPSHAAAANAAYGPTREQLAYYERLVAAFEAGTAAGHGAVLFEGEHIDLAHAQHARQLIALAADTTQDARTTQDSDSTDKEYP